MRKIVFSAALLCMGLLSSLPRSYGREIPDSAAVPSRQPDTTAASASSDSLVILGQTVHRSAVHSVRSNTAPAAYVLDTIATGVPGIRILLYSDNSWHYDKSADYIASEVDFDEYWSTTATNPYQTPLDSLDEAWSVWLLDEKSEYHAPQTGRVTSLFGIRHGRRHQGMDLSLPIGTPLYATFDGKVRISSYLGGYGNLVVIRHANGLETFYGHLSRSDVKPGDIVRAGQVIGLSGNTGRSTGPHLHFETRYRGLAFDPQRIIDFSTGNLRQRMMVLKRRYFNAASRYDQNFDDEYLNEEDDRKALEAKKKADEEAARRAMVYHKIRSGDTLSGLAKRYHTTVNNICRLNGIKSTTTLRVGKTLRVR